MQRLNVPSGLAAVGYNREDIPSLVEETLPQHRVMKLCPRLADEEDLSLMEIEQILYDNVHAARLCGLLVLVHPFQGGNPRKHKLIHDFYMRNTKQVNNWDLVDFGADKMVGA